ncbi:MAG: ATP-grasp domain-containing protein [Flavobacteriaceae bacterium]|nr:ATP-grasp domain-containing protein [Flavobacteriaceae bacterium]
MLYFTKLNSGMKFGGAILSSKIETLSKLPDRLIPKTILINPSDSFETINQNRLIKRIAFPIIAKPDNAERGKGVHKLENENDLKHLVQKIKQQTYLIQEFVCYPIELGILVHKTQTGDLQITSLCEKLFCSVTGNGKSTLGDLILKDFRVAHRVPYFKNKYQNEWSNVLQKDKTVIIEPIGNHNLGTRFCNANHRINKDIYRWLKTFMTHLPEFDYGRIDMKIANWEAFKDNKGIKILEINGVNAEPIHIYDTKQSIGQAYKSIFYHMKVIYQLSKEKKMTPPTPFQIS